MDSASLDYPIEEVLARFASAFIDPALSLARLGAEKDDPAAIRRYLALPPPARPDLSWYFDRAWYVLRHPDIAEAGADPLLHFLEHGVAEGRSPHPLIDPRYMRDAEPDLFAGPFTAEALAAALDHDRADPSPWFSRDFYRAQLGPDEAPRGLLRHFLRHGLAAGLLPAPGLDPVAAWRRSPIRTTDLRSGLAAFALFGSRAQDATFTPPPEPQTKALFVANAEALLPLHGRRSLDFGHEGAAPALSVVLVLHNRFALTMAALAGLRAAFPGPLDLVLVDSGSSDETKTIERHVRGAQILRFAENVGFVLGCNAGLAAARAPVLLFLNNDVELGPGAIEAARARLDADPTIGAVGAMLVRTHGAVQEAGSIIWRGGTTAGYMRDASPLAPEVNFVRDVDYCSAAFLLTRTALVRALGGFDPAFAPGYYEDADLCLRMREAGHRVVYDPSVIVRHLEHGTSQAVADAERAIAERRQIFVRKHMARLRSRYAEHPRAHLFARTAGPNRGRVLFIDDRIPLRHLGQGFVRANDVVRALAASGRHVTVFPVLPAPPGLADVYADLPDNVEVMHDRHLRDFEAFLRERRGYYDTIWIGRTHNLARLRPLLERGGVDVLGGVRIVLDTEAIAALREAARRAADPEAGPFDVDAALRAEFADAWFCQAIVAVNEAEAATLRAIGFDDVAVLGHCRRAELTPRPFAERQGLLFVGAIGEPSAPNLDALRWLADNVLPMLEDELGEECRLTVAGFVAPGLDLAPLGLHPRITLRGPVADLRPLYDSHRLFVAPTRFAAGIPYKLHEAAAMGLPSVATDLLAAQLGWERARDLMCARVNDAVGFATEILFAYRDEALWTKLRDNAAARVRAECDPAAFAAAIERILAREPDPP